MKKILTLASAAAMMAASGVALAQPGPDGAKFDRNADVSKADVSKADAMARADAMFKRMDANNDGLLNEADREARKAERFAKLDTNGDGELSKDERTAARAKKHDRGDKTDGKREGRRGKHWRGKRGHRGMGGMHMLAKVDTNGDKAISLAEMRAAASARFDAADADKNGVLTAAERKAAHEAMRAKWRENRQNKD